MCTGHEESSLLVLGEAIRLTAGPAAVARVSCWRQAVLTGKHQGEFNIGSDLAAGIVGAVLNEQGLVYAGNRGEVSG